MSKTLLCDWLQKNGFEYDINLWRETVSVHMPLIAEDMDRHCRIAQIDNFNRSDGRVRVRYLWLEVLLSVKELFSLLETGVMP